MKKMWAKWFRFKMWWHTLWNHRAIIEKLQDEKRWIEDNAKDIINLLGKENMRMVISNSTKMFAYTIMITNGIANRYMQSGLVIPPKRYVKNTIGEIKAFIKKGKKNVDKTNIKG